MKTSLCALLIPACFAASATAQTTQPTSHEIDTCGTLVRTADCVLFNGGGGMYLLSDYGDFKAGDTVRVVGTVATDCSTICSEADGCVRGAVVYDPARYPCGTNLPDLGGDLVSGAVDACTAAAGGLTMFTLAGLWMMQRREECDAPHYSRDP